VYVRIDVMMMMMMMMMVVVVVVVVVVVMWGRCPVSLSSLRRPDVQDSLT
jgi:hypothetical protein